MRHLRERISPWQINLWTIVFAELLMLTAFNGASVLIPYYVQQMGVSDMREVAWWTGAFQSAGGITFAIFTPIWGALGDRYGRKVMLVRAMAATTAVLLLMGLVRTPFQLLVLRFVQGCLTGTPAAATALIATACPRRHLAYSLGLLQTALMVGSSLGPMIGGYTGDLWGYRQTFFASAVVAALALVLTLLAVRETPYDRSNDRPTKHESPWHSFRILLGSGEITSLIALSLLSGLTYGLVRPVVPLFVQQLLWEPDRVASVAGTITGLPAVTAAVAALIVGRLSDRVGHHVALLGCSLGTALLFVPQALAGSPTSLGIWLSLQGLFWGGIGPNVSATIAQRSARERTGAALGLNSSASAAGFAIGPMIGAGLMAAASARLVFLAGAVLFALVSLRVLMLSRTSPSPGIAESSK